ncbi:hypothetical protein CLUG_01873 [Clavispora lusitaniae ATCC 42720]|uniref:Uncharacterized protein n=1 Tax=Clavispora lusitaniae (strain ATCC 42720) TaxID=306902 RepID=C4Y0Z1_CLAL4|nr:uncharacterized protein CLUG_01873 [Clavispora lusitaniae ATCC 42720]EEQ37750.1 hypothetical protein CLUG_01873 [Clavispora lusitaniae ATCC 42720]
MMCNGTFKALRVLLVHKREGVEQRGARPARSNHGRLHGSATRPQIAGHRSTARHGCRQILLELVRHAQPVHTIDQVAERMLECGIDLAIIGSPLCCAIVFSCSASFVCSCQNVIFFFLLCVIRIYTSATEHFTERGHKRICCSTGVSNCSAEGSWRSERACERRQSHLHQLGQAALKHCGAFLAVGLEQCIHAGKQAVVAGMERRVVGHLASNLSCESSHELLPPRSKKRAILAHHAKTSQRRIALEHFRKSVSEARSPHKFAHIGFGPRQGIFARMESSDEHKEKPGLPKHRQRGMDAPERCVESSGIFVRRNHFFFDPSISSLGVCCARLKRARNKSARARRSSKIGGQGGRVRFGQSACAPVALCVVKSEPLDGRGEIEFAVVGIGGCQ